jgi:hypothetical protein
LQGVVEVRMREAKGSGLRALVALMDARPGSFNFTRCTCLESGGSEGRKSATRIFLDFIGVL